MQVQARSSTLSPAPERIAVSWALPPPWGSGQAVGQALKEAAYEDPLVRSLHVKISGCPNGCARHHIANIGFHGAATRGANKSQIPSYELFIGGSFGSDEAARFGKRVKTKVPAKKVPSLVQDIVHYYQNEREPQEVFNRFVDRVGTEPFESARRRLQRDRSPEPGDHRDIHGLGQDPNVQGGTRRGRVRRIDARMGISRSKALRTTPSKLLERPRGVHST